VSNQLQCPLCSVITRHSNPPQENWGVILKDAQFHSAVSDGLLEDIPTGDIREIYICPCGRSTWLQDKGWTISFNFISKLNESIWQSNNTLSMALRAFLSNEMPKEIQNVEAAMDRSTVKLYCPNDKCSENGYLTRTKVQAENHTLFCDSCQTALQWS